MDNTLDPRIQKVGDVANEAFKELHSIQTKKKLILKTGEEMIDCHIGGLLPGDVVLIAGNSGTGKSETLYRMLDNILSTEVNPNAEKFVSLEYSMEMKMLNKLLRKTHSLLGKKKTDILFEVFSEEEKDKVRKYNESLKDDRRSVVQAPVSPQDFYKMTKSFCELHKDKEAVVISMDHMLLFIGGDKQKVLEEIAEAINLIKLEFHNVYFLPLSQLNRANLSVIKEKSNDMIPNNTHLFGSSHMEQLASYIIIITNPLRQKVNQYLKVSKDTYNYLEDFFGDIDTKDRASFNTLGRLFYFITKTRETDNHWKDLFIKDMDLSKEQLEKMKLESKEIEEVKIPQFEMPVFNKEVPVMDPRKHDIF